MLLYPQETNKLALPRKKKNILFSVRSNNLRWIHNDVKPIEGLAKVILGWKNLRLLHHCPLTLKFS